MLTRFSMCTLSGLQSLLIGQHQERGSLVMEAGPGIAYQVLLLWGLELKYNRGQMLSLRRKGPGVLSHMTRDMPGRKGHPEARSSTSFACCYTPGAFHPVTFCIWLQIHWPVCSVVCLSSPIPQLLTILPQHGADSGISLIWVQNHGSTYQCLFDLKKVT